MMPKIIIYRHPIADNGVMYTRILNLSEALDKKSHFLFGPRATGKSWLIEHQFQGAQVFDLLNTDTYDRLLRRPHSLEEETHSQLVVIDEIQKLPRLLDEVHRLIEKKKIHFLLTGSSARKLKHGGANLLAGRARSLSLFPLTSREIKDFDMERYCNVGGLPMIHSSSEPWLDLKEYVHLYMKEEIVAEGIVRRIDHYARFMDVIGLRSGEALNYQQIASDSGVPPRTVDHFVEILKDALLALAFEHFIIQEIRAFLSYRNRDEVLSYWRTVGGRYEVDCIIGNQVAIEIKSSETFTDKMLAGMSALQDEKK